MAITADQVAEAVSKFLPRNLDVARDSDSGQLPQSRVTERALQIVRTSLLLDPEASLHSLSLAVTAWVDALQLLEGNLTRLVSNDLLLSLEDEAPHFISDLTGLQAIDVTLLKMQSSVVTTGEISSTYESEFVSAVEDFVSDEIAPNVQNRNRTVIRDEAKSLFSSIEPQWEAALEEQVDITARVDSFVAADLKSTVITEAIEASRTRVAELLSELDGATSAVQAAAAEEILVDLAAVKAVIELINDADSPEGTTVVGPLRDGRTPTDHLRRSGYATPEFPDVITLPSGARRGTSGRINLADKVISGGHGDPLDDADGDTVTPTFQDLTADFVGDGVEEGNFLCLVQTGSSHRVLTVAATELTVTPELPLVLADDDRYLVLEEPIGTYFKDEDESFWEAYATGASGSNVVMSGSAGEFPEEIRLEGTNGSNAKAYSTSGGGEAIPARAEGSDGQPYGDYTHSNSGGLFYINWEIVGASSGSGNGIGGFRLTGILTTFLDDGVEVGDYVYIDTGPEAGTHIVSAVISNTVLEVDSAWAAAFSAETFRIRSRSTVYRLSAPFTEAMVGQRMVLSNPPAVATQEFWGPFEITEFVSTQLVKLDVGANLLGYSTDVNKGFSTFSVVDIADSNWESFYSATMNAYSSLIEAGDHLEVSGYTTTPTRTEDLNGVWDITDVIDDGRVEIDASGTFGFPSEAMYTETGLTWRVLRGDVDYEKVFTDPDGEFLSSGVAAGDVLYLDDGAGADVGSSFTIDSVESQTTVILTTAFTEAADGYDYHISPVTEDFVRDPDVNMYSGLIQDGLSFTFNVETSVPSGQEGEYDLTEDALGVNTLETADTLANSDLYLYSDWKVVPEDDQTAYFSQTDLDFADYDGGGSSLKATVELDGSLGLAYLVVEGEDPLQVVLIVRDDPYDLTSSSSKLRFNDRVDLAAGPLDWEVWSDLTTSTFTDSTNAPFANVVPGDIIRIYPGTGDQQDLVITEAVSSSEVTVAPEIDAGVSSIPYVLFGAVRPGMELVAGGRRTTILDIDSEHVLKLDKPIHPAAGIDLTWVVVRPGVDLDVFEVSDRDASFIANDGFGLVANGIHDWVVGATLEIMGERPLKALIQNAYDRDGDGVYETLLISRPLTMEYGALAYQIRDAVQGKSSFFGSVSDSFGDAAAGDYLTVWGVDQVFTVLDVVDGMLKVTPRIQAGLDDQDHVLIRSGTKSWGRFVLLEYLLGLVTLESDLDLLKLRLAEVVADFGGDVIEGPVAGTTSPAFVEDGDEDDETDVVSLDTVSGIEVGDRVDLIVGAETWFSYVREVDATGSLIKLYKEFDQTASITSCSVYKNSVSYVLSDALDRLTEVQALLTAARGFSVPVSTALLASKKVLAQVGLDRAEDAIDSGDLTSLVGMDADSASSNTYADVAVRTAGRTTDVAGSSDGTAPSRRYTAGVDPATGISGRHGALPPVGSVIVGEEANTRIALADLAEWLTADARVHQAAQLSLDDLRSRRIYELIGEVDSGLVTDTDPTLPWIAQTGSASDRLMEIEEAAIAALDYMIDHPDQFEDVEET
jgi:hypothetical protein